MNKRIKNIFSRKSRDDSSSAEELRIDFKTRYHQFKLLLSANNTALELMAEIEDTLAGSQPFGMTFVRDRCTRISTNVFKMIRHLGELGPGKYEALPPRFNEIQNQINPIVFGKSRPKDGPHVLAISEIDRNTVDLVGAKMANLGEIRNNIRLRVPAGFVITAAAYHRFVEHNDLQPEIDRLIQSTEADNLDQRFGLSATIQQSIIRAAVPDDLLNSISENYRILEKDEGRKITLAMRSSALGEDLAGASFAGQYRSALNVSSENMAQAYKEIVASKYSLPAMTYRLNRGIRDQDVAMCVGCMSMVDAASGGVLYSRNPLNIRDDSIVINSAWGLPKSVVDGRIRVDSFIVTRGEPMQIRHKEIPLKSRKLVCFPEEGVCRMDIMGDEGSRASLTDEQAIELARTAVKIERHYQIPLDIEWGLDKEGAVFILQCRPLKQIDAPASQDPKIIGVTEPESLIVHGGVTASPGAGSGPVFIVRNDMDALNFPQGAVLVAEQALPRWATLLSRAAAVVAEQGSVTGHLANVSREFRVPALFGVENVLDLLGRGQVVTVDADGRRIYQGRMEPLLRDAAPHKNLMAGSSVYEALKAAAQHITPLNLLNPDALFFKPEKCKTFHDITRFCHEKAVQEMFHFGKDHHFPERSSKQLFFDVPMKWWVLNLDDGFKDEIKGKYVKLDNIVSIPMLALWEGIIRIPWEGPPPVDSKGFMSVMFQATTNPALTIGVRTPYADRNYFLISKNYCCLTSRLGFHFSTVETMVSERRSENYISFHYKGGAADNTRRGKRVGFIAEILEQYGFRVEITEDHLSARLDDQDLESMKAHLMILGYLTIHTRQLDMIMANENSVNYYRGKFKKDIDALIAKN